MRHNFSLYSDQRDAVTQLTDEQAGKLIKAIYKYVCDNEMPNFPEYNLQSLFLMIVYTIDSDTLKRYKFRIKTRNSQKETEEHICDIEQKFLEFWEMYPRKQAQKDALKEFKKLSPNDDLFDVILNALKFMNETLYSWIEYEYIPYPVNWIRGRRWEDVFEN